MPIIDDTGPQNFISMSPLPVPENKPEKQPGVAYFERGGAQPLSDLLTDPWNYGPLKAQMEQLNPWVSWSASEASGFMGADYDPDFDLVAALKDTPWQDDPGRFAFAKNAAHLKAMQDDIEREEGNRALLEDAGTSANLVTGFMALAADPISYVGPGALATTKALRAASSLGRATLVAGAVGTDVAIQEGILQATQQTRTAAESVTNIGGSMVLGAILGGVVSRSLTAAELRELSDGIEKAIEVPIRSEDDWMGLGGLRSVGAQAVGDGAPKIPAQLEGALGMEKSVLFTGKASPGRDPVLSILNSPLLSARETGTQLFETVLGLTRNADGVTTAPIGGAVETRIKTQGYGPLGAAQTAKDSLFSQYALGAQKRFATIRSAIGRKLGTNPNASYKEFNEEIGRSMARFDEHAIPEVEQAAKVYRKMFTAKAEEAVELGLLEREALGSSSKGARPNNVMDEVWDDVGQSYITRLYNRAKMAAKPAEFKRITIDYLVNAQARAEIVLGKLKSQATGAAGKVPKALDDQIQELQTFTGLSRQELAEDAAKIFDHIMGAPEGRMLFTMPDTLKGPFKARTFRIKDELIEEFLERNIDRVARFYMRSVTGDIEMTRMFGSIDMTAQIAKINDEAHALAEAKPELAEKILAKDTGYRDRAISDLMAIADRMRGTYAMPDNPMDWLPRIGRTIRTLNYLRLLGGMTISALPDTMSAIAKYGVTSTLRDGFLPLVASLKTVKAAGEEVKLAGTALDMILDTRAQALADVLDDYGRYSKIERALTAAQENFGVISLMAPWNAAMKQWVGMIGMTNMLRAMEKVANGTADRAIVRKLAQSSIDEDTAKIIYTQYKKHGREQNGVLLPNTTKWETADPQVRLGLDAFRGALARDVDRIIVTPGQEKPLWMSKEWGKTVGQFKSFGVSSMQRTLLAGLQERDAGVFVGFTSMIAMGAIANSIKLAIAGRPQPTDIGDIAKNAIDYSGVTGYLFEINNFAEKMTGGVVGINSAMRLTGVPTASKPMTRYVSRNWMDAISGPTGGAIEDIVRVSNMVGRGTTGSDLHESDIRAARRLLPFQNLFYVSWLFRAVEQGAVDATGAKRSGVK